MKIKPRFSPSIGQNILIATLSIVSFVLILSSVLYYFVFSARTDVLIESQSREINKQIVLNYEQYIASIIETANYIQSSTHLLDMDRDYDEMQNIYLVNSQVKQDVVAIFLFDQSGSKLLGDPIRPLHSRFVSESQWFGNALKNPEIFHFQSTGEQSASLERSDEVISVTKKVSFIQSGKLRTGVLLIELNFEVISNLADKTNLGDGGHILIVGSDDSLIYTSESPFSATSESLLAATAAVLGGAKMTIGDHDLFMNINTLENTRWRIATFTNVDEIDAIRRSMLPLLLIIFVITVLVTAAVAAILSYRISGPVRQLQGIMRRIEDGEIDVDITISGQREIVMLGRSFNSMIIKIRSLMERLVDEQRDKRKTELRALQNQINPHFLYNSLDSIVWLAEHDRSEDVITTVVALARFFRISISKGNTFIPVRDEIDHVKNYLKIQTVRYADRFQYFFHIDERLMDRNVMKLILQPLVENAIYHGMDEQGGVIEVNGSLDGKMMRFEVKNTGYGLTAARIREIHRH
ncbi:MAG: histidine kinase, partial [Spirochaetaceae bacterium]|nr:histidine kinase [Spirochaetaceae bacterium]